MENAAQAILTDWTLPVPLTIVMLAVALLYARGWWLLRKTRPVQFVPWRLLCFLAGMATLWVSICSPMDGFADSLLSAHMIEHVLLMSFVPPLVLLGQPVVPMLRGMPRWFTRIAVGPFIRRRSLRNFGRWLTSPLVAWLLMNMVFLGWHLPKAYDFALEHETWHDVEHLCFLGTSILFWWPLLQPWPSKQRGPGWWMLPYLAFADIVNTILSGFLAFCERPVYSYYVRQPNGFGISPLMDQRAGAAAMWVIGSIVFLFPAVGIAYRLLERNGKLPQPAGPVLEAIDQA